MLPSKVFIIYDEMTIVLKPYMKLDHHHVFCFVTMYVMFHVILILSHSIVVMSTVATKEY